MIVLTICTDKPEAEIGLFDNDSQLAYVRWHAHRQLAETLHTAIEDMLTSQAMSWKDLQGIVAFEGPGSFTGLRIGLAVANALAYDLSIPIVATKDEHWITKGVARLQAGEQDEIALPFYGRDANITIPKK